MVFSSLLDVSSSLSLEDVNPSSVEFPIRLPNTPHRVRSRLHMMTESFDLFFLQVTAWFNIFISPVILPSMLCVVCVGCDSLYYLISTGAVTCVWGVPQTHLPSVPHQAPGVKSCSFQVRSCGEDSTVLETENMQNALGLCWQLRFLHLWLLPTAEDALPNLICAANGLNAQWMLLFQLTKRQETAPRCLCCIEQRVVVKWLLCDSCIFGRARPGGKVSPLNFNAETQSFGPFLFSTSPLEVFFFLL